MACEGSCEDQGRTFASGDNWTCSDGCNYCSYDEGVVTSTLIGCPGPPEPLANKLSCENDDGYWHRHGEPWPCEVDGACVTCNCDDGTTSSAAPESVETCDAELAAIRVARDQARR